jgi:hypothetical protein
VKPYYYVRSGCWDILDQAEVKLPDEGFYSPGSETYAAAITAMTRAEQLRWVRFMQTVETVMTISGTMPPKKC